MSTPTRARGQDLSCLLDARSVAMSPGNEMVTSMADYMQHALADPTTRGGGISLDFDFDFDFDHPQHTIVGITGENQCGNHRDDAAWYYGTDIVVHPDHRRCGIGRRLYELRKEVVRRHNKRGIIAGGHIPGYADHKHELPAAEYVAKVVSGELYDATLSFQLGNGFEARGVLENYIEDEATDGWAALIVWENPDFSA